MMDPHKYCSILFVGEAGSPGKGAFESNTNTHTHTCTQSLQGEASSVAKLQLSEGGDRSK